MNQEEKRSIIAGLYGNTLEWYDFLLYASFAPLFAKLFFPSDVEFISLMATFTAFAVGFLMRPLGGLLLGHYADHVGRRKALIVSVSIMTASTTSIAFLPAYNTAGAMAPVLFVLFRLVQGLAVGGELPSSTTFLVEHMAHKRRGFAGSLVLSTAFLGIFFGSLTAASLSRLLHEQQLLEWGWRLAYFLGGMLGLIGIHLRINSIEPAVFIKAKPEKELPAQVIFSRYRSQLLLAVMFTSILAIGNYILIAYMTTFLVNSEGFLLADALTINCIALLILTILIPFMGLLSDYLGRKLIFLSGLLGLLILIFPIFLLLLSGNWLYAFLSEVLLVLVLAPINATVPTIITEMFPTPVRASGISISYNLGQALFGGTVTLVALSLVRITNDKLSPAWYVFLWAIIAITTTKYLQETYKKALD
ncbi:MULTISPECIES: MFS transporter [unclassified Legionella]|uniref:MFS transporter n=1 Tax=unclassified Legionella TaxID=2622702 RepID=UPI001054EAA1|nr:MULTISPECIES: MFS transporter [unclassified Legionella]MDI9818092.1 MFS transporter [Legionella sp. PL877]